MIGFTFLVGNVIVNSAELKNKRKVRRGVDLSWAMSTWSMSKNQQQIQLEIPLFCIRKFVNNDSLLRLFTVKLSGAWHTHVVPLCLRAELYKEYFANEPEEGQNVSTAAP